MSCACTLHSSTASCRHEHMLSMSREQSTLASCQCKTKTLLGWLGLAHSIMSPFAMLVGSLAGVDTMLLHMHPMLLCGALQCTTHFPVQNSNEITISSSLCRLQAVHNMQETTACTKCFSVHRGACELCSHFVHPQESACVMYDERLADHCILRSTRGDARDACGDNTYGCLVHSQPTEAPIQSR